VVAAAAADVVRGSLDGYLFACGGRVDHKNAPPYYGFVGSNEVHCPKVFGTGSYLCGFYNYTHEETGVFGEESSTSLELTLADRYNFIQGTFEGIDLRIIDGILVSYRTEPENRMKECTVQSLDWKKLYQGLYNVFFWCGAHNVVAGQSFEEKSFSLDSTGNFHYQSQLEYLSGTQPAVRRDRYGVFVWDVVDDDAGGGPVTLYAGPQNDEGPVTLGGTLSTTGVLRIRDPAEEYDYVCQAETVTESEMDLLPIADDYLSFGDNTDHDAAAASGNNDGNKIGLGGFVIISETTSSAAAASGSHSFRDLLARMCCCGAFLSFVAF